MDTTIAHIHDNEARVKLYAWKPDGHGQYSFFVAATSEDEALLAVKKHMEEEDGIREYETRGFGTDYYNLTVLPIGVAISNPNS